MGQHQGDVQIILVNFFSSAISNNIFSFQFHINKKIKISILLILFISLGCASSKRFSESRNFNDGELNTIRVLIGDNDNEHTISVDENLLFSKEDKTIAKVNSGNKIRINNSSGKLSVSIANKIFESNVFYLYPITENEIIKIDEKKYRGRIKIISSNSKIKIVNQIGLEDYVKGVMIKEMPIGKGLENYEALKAFSICARTYALQKLKEDKEIFDIYPDTRDQVYGGVDGETVYTNQIVDETKDQILAYDDDPAVIFYFSTCGGHTEDVINVFSKEYIPYLAGVEDGTGPFCKISPRYEWIETYSDDIFVERLYNAKLINSLDYKLSEVKIKSRFESGRVKELEIILLNNDGEVKSFVLIGNGMRSVIRTSDGKSILKSTVFDISVDSYNNITIKGKGSGHGVGLCQWGAIGQSRIGISYKKILDYYFLGTKINSIYD